MGTDVEKAWQAWMVVWATVAVVGYVMVSVGFVADRAWMLGLGAWFGAVGGMACAGGVLLPVCLGMWDRLGRVE